MNRTITYPPQSPRPANGGYRYFFNGQEADNEVLGDGVSLTAEFWQYDSRLGRRWNVDPVFKEYESPFMNRWDGPSVVKDGYASALLKLSFIPADKLTTGGWMQTYSSNLPDDDTGNYDESLPSSTTLFERVDAQTVEYNKDPDFADYFRDPPSFTLEDIPPFLISNP